ncbi:MAG: TIGR03862 family flavoprotein [Pseudomonadota bacterium]
MGQIRHRARATVIGAGPAGLMAADRLAVRGIKVDIYDRMPSPARKFLMAGKSGLNITNTRPGPVAFDGNARLEAILEAFGPTDVMAWMDGLGQAHFVGSSGRVFPKAMKASPLLRAWLTRLNAAGVTIHRRALWTGWDHAALCFEGMPPVQTDVTVLALGGGSWARLGSDGVWAQMRGLANHVAPFQPSNIGLRRSWSPHMAPHFGAPLKNLVLRAGDLRTRGEIVLSERGIEGGGLYPLTPALRARAPLLLDLKPDVPLAQVAERLAARGKASWSNHLRKALRLSPAAIGLLNEVLHPLPNDLAAHIKGLQVPTEGLRPLDEAISTAGGLRFDALTPELMMRDRPGTFACGEMLDWDAPTGGYLLTICLATGRWAGDAAAAYLGQ